jgi:hypothetical protein
MDLGKDKGSKYRKRLSRDVRINGDETLGKRRAAKNHGGERLRESLRATEFEI